MRCLVTEIRQACHSRVVQRDERNWGALCSSDYTDSAKLCARCRAGYRTALVWSGGPIAAYRHTLTTRLQGRILRRSHVFNVSSSFMSRPGLTGCVIRHRETASFAPTRVTKSQAYDLKNEEENCLPRNLYDHFRTQFRVHVHLLRSHNLRYLD